MNIETKTYVKVLTPEEPTNVLCNGATYGRNVTIPLLADANEWAEMTEDEAKDILASDEEITDEEFGAMVMEVL